MAGARARKLDLSGLIQLGGQATRINAGVGAAKARGLRGLSGGIARGLASVAAERRHDKDLSERRQERDAALSQRRQEQDTRNKFALLEILGGERTNARNRAAELASLKVQDPEMFSALGLDAELQKAQNALTHSGKQFAGVVRSIDPSIDIRTPLPGGATGARKGVPPTTGDNPADELLALNAEFARAKTGYEKALRKGNAEGMAFHERRMRKISGQRVAVGRRLRSQTMSIFQANLGRVAALEAKGQIGRDLTKEERDELFTYIQARTASMQEAVGKLSETDIKRLKDEAVEHMLFISGAKELGGGKKGGEPQTPEEILSQIRQNNPVKFEMSAKDIAAGVKPFSPHKDKPFVPPGMDLSNDAFAVPGPTLKGHDGGDGPFPTETKVGGLISYLIQVERARPGSLEALEKAENVAPLELRAARKALAFMESQAEGRRLRERATKQKQAQLQKIADLKAEFQLGGMSSANLAKRLRALGINSIEQLREIAGQLPSPSKKGAGARPESKFRAPAGGVVPDFMIDPDVARRAIKTPARNRR